MDNYFYSIKKLLHCVCEQTVFRILKKIIFFFNPNPFSLRMFCYTDMHSENIRKAELYLEQDVILLIDDFMLKDEDMNIIFNLRNIFFEYFIFKLKTIVMIKSEYIFKFKFFMLDFVILSLQWHCIYFIIFTVFCNIFFEYSSFNANWFHEICNYLEILLIFKY